MNILNVYCENLDMTIILDIQDTFKMQHLFKIKWEKGDEKHVWTKKEGRKSSIGEFN